MTAIPRATGFTTTETNAKELELLIEAADTAAPHWAAVPAAARAEMLRSIARGIDNGADELIALAREETRLTEERLSGEINRTTFQLRLFADMLADASYLDARVDHADNEWPMGPRPDIRRVLEPLGPVVVFAASNFPFAFSIAGGDTCSALAAGCPVIVKAHPGHPKLSAATGRIVTESLAWSGSPEGVFSVIFGTQAGRDALTDPRIKAGAFTGSIPGGRALFDFAVSRPEPIPFYGELGSVNPVFVTKAAATARGEQIAHEFISSYTLGAGQFCTKPGILFIPEGSAIIAVLQTTGQCAAAPLLNARIQQGYIQSARQLFDHPAVEPIIQSHGSYADPPAPSLASTTIQALLSDPGSLTTECFGPTALIVRYHDEHELLQAARILPGQLTATIHGDDTDTVAPKLIRLLAQKAGRILWNEWPTGVSVTYAQQHGGPYPATTAPTTTSVGTASISRFLRPVAYQGLPDNLLPQPLQNANPLHIPRQINGSLPFRDSTPS